MSAEVVKPEVIPLATEEDTHRKLSKQAKRPAHQLALDRNYQLMDSFIQTKWPDNVDATRKEEAERYAH
jgi:hypothetical protein